MTPPAGRPNVSFAAVCLMACVFLCITEGGIRRWVLPGSSPAVQGMLLFSKDVPLLLAVVLGTSRAATGGLGRQVFNVLSFGTIFVGLGTIASVDGFSPVGAIMTSRNGLLLYWAAYRVGPMLQGRSDIVLLCHMAGVFAVVNAVIGQIQFSLPPDHWLNAMTSEQIGTEGAVGRVRACGTFSYINGLSNMCIFGCWAGSVLVGRSPTRPFGYVYVLAGLTCAAVTMSRSGALYGVALVVLNLASRPAGRNAAVALALFAVIGYIGYGDRLTDDTGDVGVYSAIVRRHNTAGDTIAGRALGSYVDELPAAVGELPFGMGMGQGQTGGRVVASDTGLVTQFAYEGEPGRVVAELGLLGFLGVYIIRAGLPYLLFLWRPSRSGEAGSSSQQSVWWPTTWYMVLGVNMMVVFDHVQATFQAIAFACVLAVAARPGGRDR